MREGKGWQAMAMTAIPSTIGTPAVTDEAQGPETREVMVPEYFSVAMRLIVSRPTTSSPVRRLCWWVVDREAMWDLAVAFRQYGKAQ